MTAKKPLTKAEKTMNAVRLPLIIPAFLVGDLCLSGLALAMMLLSGLNTMLIIALGVFLVIPAIVGLMLYTNYLILFDKRNIVYRDLLRRAYRFSYADIIKVKESEGFFSHIVMTQHDLLVANGSQNGQWLMELALKQQGKTIEKKEREERNVSFDTIMTIVTGIGGLLLFPFFSILVSCVSPESVYTRSLLHSVLLFMVGIPLFTLIHGIVFYRREKYMEADEYGRYGYYLIHRKGYPTTQLHDRRLWVAVFFTALGFCLNSLTLLFYAIGLVFWVLYFVREYRVRHLWACSETYVRKVLATQHPSPQLAAKLPEQYQKFIVTDYSPSHFYRYYETEEEEAASFENHLQESDDESFFIFLGKGTLIVALIVAIVSLSLFCNYYLHDERFSQVYEYSSPLLYDAETNAENGRKIAVYALNQKSGFQDDLIYLPIAETGKTERELLISELENGEVFHFVITKIDCADRILELKDDSGHVFLSKEDSRAMLLRNIIPWMIRFAIAAVMIAVIGGMMLLYGIKRSL